MPPSSLGGECSAAPFVGKDWRWVAGGLEQEVERHLRDARAVTVRTVDFVDRAVRWRRLEGSFASQEGSPVGSLETWESHTVAIWGM